MCTDPGFLSLSAGVKIGFISPPTRLMMRISWTESAFHFVDRLYGTVTLPPFISSLVRCPAIMRLREVRMANINFLHYPGFADATRFEHSLGACYLASIAAAR